RILHILYRAIQRQDSLHILRIPGREIPYRNLPYRILPDRIPFRGQGSNRPSDSSCTACILQFLSERQLELNTQKLTERRRGEGVEERCTCVSP
ncbi:hypothetical protein PMAYCL1PPCAC_22165, partial [Pristionchus mayeri]